MLGRTFTYQKETLSKFVELVDEKKINLLGIAAIERAELINIAKTVGIENVDDKSLEGIRGEIEHLGKVTLAGQVTKVTSPLHPQNNVIWRFGMITALQWDIQSKNVQSY